MTKSDFLKVIRMIHHSKGEAAARIWMKGYLHNYPPHVQRTLQKEATKILKGGN